MELVHAPCGMEDAVHQRSCPVKKLNRKVVLGAASWEFASYNNVKLRWQKPVMMGPHRLHKVSLLHGALELALTRTPVTHWGAGLRKVPH